MLAPKSEIYKHAEGCQGPRCTDLRDCINMTISATASCVSCTYHSDQHEPVIDAEEAEKSDTSVDP